MPVPTIAVFVGSLRRESCNRRLALALEKLAGDRARFQYVRIDDLPLYNQDFDGSYPAQGTRLKDEVRGADAVLFVTPEYNRSIPGAMKNAIDVGSRPYGQSGFSGKPGAVLSASPGAIGGFGANHHLRQCLVFLDVHVLQQPEAYLGGAGNFFDENGVLSDGIKPFLQKFIDAYAAWVAKQLG